MIAPRLESLYQYALSQLTLANIKSDKKPGGTQYFKSLIRSLDTVVRRIHNTGQG